MFWQALIWGLGVSLGATVGLTVWVFAIEFAKRRCGTAGRVQDVNERSLEALTKRNELSEEMCDYLQRISVAMERKSP